MEGANRICIVTGATGAIGQAIAQGISATPGHTVVLACRNEKKARRAVEQIRQVTGNEAVRYALVDVSRQASVREFAQGWQGPLHVLVNNAAVAPRRRQETPEGIELQFATNVLGYLWMADALVEALQAGAPSRIVNVASYWAGGLDLDDLEFTRRSYDNDDAYRQSKQANRMLTAALARRFAPLGISVNACHPGDVVSALSSDLGFGGHQSAEQGAENPVMLATSAAGQENTGCYFERGAISSCRFSQDESAVEALYAACKAHGLSMD